MYACPVPAGLSQVFQLAGVVVPLVTAGDSKSELVSRFEVGFV